VHGDSFRLPLGVKGGLGWPEQLYIIHFYLILVN